MTYIHKGNISDRSKVSENYVLKVYKNGLVDRVVRTHSKRLFLTRLRSLKFLKAFPRVYLRVSYGKHEDVYGKIQYFYNDGDYESYKELIGAYDAFTEV